MTDRAPVFTVRPLTYNPWEQARPNYLLTVLATIAPTRKFVQTPDTRPAVFPRAIDFQFPNLALLNFAQLRVRPVGQALDESVPAPTVRQLDFAFRNVALENFAQLQVQPVGKELDETIPAPVARQIDFQFRNVALENFAQLQVKPIGAMLDEATPVVLPRQLDFQFPNVALQAFAQLQVFPIGEQSEDVRPSPQVRQLDQIQPNLLLIQPVSAPISARIFDQPAAVQRQQDFQPPNLIVTQAAPDQFIKRKPLIGASRPIRQLPADTLAPNLVINIPVADLTKIFRPPLITRQAPLQPPTDPPVPSLLTTTLSTVVVKPTVPPEFIDKPAPQQRVQEFVPQNTPLLNFQQLQLKPTGKALDETVPSPQARPVDFQFPNVVNQPTVIPPDLTKLFRPPLITRPVATKLPTDAPIPNLLTTTLAVVVVKPLFSYQFFGDRPAPQQRIEEFVPQNLTLRLPVAPNPSTIQPSFLFAIKPAPSVPPIDFAFPNLPLILTPPTPPPPSVSELPHQNPVFVTMGRLLTLQGDIGSGIPANAYVTEDGTLAYVAEDGTTFYVQES